MSGDGFTVRLTADKQAIYAFLSRDPVWAAYAIGDLEPALFGHTEWHLAATGHLLEGVALVYAGLEPPVLLTMGEDAAVAAVLGQMPLPRRVYMSAQVGHLPALLRHYDFGDDRVRPMLRMAVAAARFRPAPAAANGLRLRRLGQADAQALQALYALGGDFAPDAFDPYQLQDGIFLGLEHAGGLVAVAGTHLVAPTYRVAAVGNIYTHPAHRGQGLSQVVTGAVTAELLGHGFLVVLNVDRDNKAAIHIYEKLGYRVHCPFLEGIGVKRSA